MGFAQQIDTEFDGEVVVGTTSDSRLPRDVFDALALIEVGLVKLLRADMNTDDTHTAIELIEATEGVKRQTAAVVDKVFGSIDSTGVHLVDGHRTAKQMIAHVAKIPGAAANTRQRNTGAMHILPAVAEAFEAGLVSTSMVDRLGRLYANARVRHLMGDADDWFLLHALEDSYEMFNLVVSHWEELADQDGADQRDRRNDQNRKHRMTQNEDGSWAWSGSCASYDGAITSDVFEAFEKIEFDIDWQWVRNTHGDDACPDLMPRTPAQRRADAFAKIHIYAAKGLEADGGPSIVTNIVIDHETFERETLRLLGEDVGPDDPLREDFCSSTIDGKRVYSRSAVAHALLDELRRVVIGADSVIIDLGRKRLFTGYARLAAQLQAHECYWPGCHVPASRCQIDHLIPHSERGRDPTTGAERGGGKTDPRNSGPECGGHNRHKELGYTVTRKPDGTIEIRRPDGTILE